MTFQLDTSGFVPPSMSANPPLLQDMRWDDLTPFTQGYVEAFLADFAATPLGREMANGGWFVSFGDLAPEALAQIIKDCASRENDFGFGMDSPKAGAGFWASRQCGASQTFPPLTVQLGDDGKVRFGQ
jgi:hypothetical protein